MRLNFDQLHVFPPSPAPAWEPKTNLDLSRLSRRGKMEAGQQKPSIHAGVPACPACPVEKTGNLQGIESSDELLARLAQFRFDLVEADIASGAPTAELDRVNNLCWEFMDADGMPFDQALAVAASIVVTCEPAPCEAGYTDVRQLWRELTSTQQPTSTQRRKS